MTTAASSMTLAGLLERLAEEGRIAGGEPGDDLARRLDQALRGRDAHEAPWYVHLFVGFGTWIGAVIAAVFLGVIGLLDDAGEAGFVGILLFVAAVLVARRSETSVLATQLTSCADR